MSSPKCLGIAYEEYIILLPLGGLLAHHVASSLPPNHPQPPLHWFTMGNSEQQRKVHRGRLQLARKKEHQVASTAPISKEFRCAICQRICRSRIGLLSHQRTHKRNSTKYTSYALSRDCLLLLLYTKVDGGRAREKSFAQRRNSMALARVSSSSLYQRTYHWPLGFLPFVSCQSTFFIFCLHPPVLVTTEARSWLSTVLGTY